LPATKYPSAEEHLFVCEKIALRGKFKLQREGIFYFGEEKSPNL
jgi:hypothetical protein